MQFPHHWFRAAHRKLVRRARRKTARPLDGSRLSLESLEDRRLLSTMTFERRVAQGLDDAEEIASGSMRLASGDLELVDDRGVQTIGLRFSGVQIPPTAIISSAYVQFQVDETSSGTTNLTIRGQAAGNAAAFGATRSSITSRPRTVASAAWSPRPWTVRDAAGLDQRTTDLSAVIQEIVHGGGWTQGNALALIISGTGKRIAEAYEGGPSRAPLLHVEYTVGGGPTNRPPVLGSIANQSVNELATLSLYASATDPDLPGQTLTYRLDAGSVAAGMTIHSTTGAFAWTPSAAQGPGDYNVTVTVSDNGTPNLSDAESFTITVSEPVNGPIVFERRVAGRLDDAEETASGSMRLASGDLELVDDGGVQTIGLRFSGVQIPPTAIISSAYVQFQVDETSSGTTNLTIRGQAAGNAAAFAATRSNITSRPRTVASAAWSPRPWTVRDAAGLDQRTTDLSAVIQEIVRGGGWTQGNALALIISGTGKRIAEAYEGGPSRAPLLHVEYRLPGSGDVAPPVLMAALTNDTGGNVTDGQTADPSVAGSVSDASPIVALRAGFDTAVAVSFFDIFADLRPDGTFALSPGRLNQIHGSPLADGPHTLHLIATDSAGNVSSFFDVSFVLDTLPPTIGPPNLLAAHDTAPAGDRQTTLATVTLVGLASPVTTVALFETGASTTSDASGNFEFAGVALALGANSFTVTASDAAGNQSTASGTITRLPSDSFAPTLSAALTNDTGESATDGNTSDPTVAGFVFDSNSIAALTAGFGSTPVSNYLSILTDVTADGTFQLSRAQLEQINAGPLLDGPHTLHLRATDQPGNVATFDLAFRLDTTLPAIPAVDLSPASDTGSLGDRQTGAARVTLVGQTEPGALLTLAEIGLTTLAATNGSFRFADVALADGQNAFTVSATDLAGNTSQFAGSVTRAGQITQADPVITWNQTALEAIRLDGTTPPMASRGLGMLHAAIFDAVNAIDGSPGYYVAIVAPTGSSPEAAVSGAAHRVLSYLYPAQQALFDAVLANALAAVPNGSAENDGLALGRDVAEAVIALRSGDGWDTFVDYHSAGGPGIWESTAPMFAEALLPQWAILEPFAMTSPDQFRPDGPPALESGSWADAYNEVKDVGRFDSSTRTADQTQIARFWADGPGTYSPPGHWNVIAEQAAQAEGNSLASNARLFAQLNVAMADAAIAAWDAKYAFNSWRPITAIQDGDTDGNDLTAADDDWSSLLITPPFPDYISGHSTFSGAAATVLSTVFGENYAFATTSIGLAGVSRSFASFQAAAEEAGQSRIYGGIHYQFANQDGLATGRALAAHVLDTFAFSTDTQAPRIIVENPASDLVTAVGFSLSGRVLDNVTGVASLEAQLDEGSFATVPFDALGKFSIPVNAASDGDHLLRLRATDALGNVSIEEFSFTRDTAAPTIAITSPTSGGSIAVRDRLEGTVGGTGSAVARFSYAFDGGTAMPITFDPVGGAFSVPLDLSKLLAGNHNLTVSARDSAGNTSSATLNVQLAQAIPLTILEHAPHDGAVDVGSTFKPKVVFSRPINPASLTSTNFFATDAGGNTLAANIVPATDGTFAWLFFEDPLPGGSRITVHVDGSTILAASDGQALDADLDSIPGGSRQFSFTTVSLTPLLGTSLSGKVLDPGPDLDPMTFDDIRVGPDGVLHTADDVFLLPIAGAKVFIIGLESQFVLTDAQGNFRFDMAPAGNVKLAIDGNTATNAPAGFYFPEMVMDLNLDAGRANTVMGAMGKDEARVANRDRQEVYLPRLRTTLLQNVSNTAVTEIGVNPESAPNLSPEQRAMLSIAIQPGSLLDQNGNPLAAGQVGISTVPSELVREMLPPGLLQHTFDITVQAPGITNFATPAPMTFPNLFGAAPGTQLNFLSFDHTTGRLVIEGTATVSADGLSASTDPGTGITHPGWHGLTPPGDPGGPEYCPAPPPVPNSSGMGLAAANLLAAAPGVSNSVPVLLGVKDWLFTQDNESAKMTFFNNASLPQPGQDPCSPENMLASQMLVDIKFSPESQLFLRGINVNELFSLRPGEFKEISFSPTAIDLAKFTQDAIYGAKYTVTISQVDPGNVIHEIQAPQTYYLYRYVDASDDKTDDGILKFSDTQNDGAGNTQRERFAESLGDPTAVPRLVVPSSEFNVLEVEGQTHSTYHMTFDPRHTEDNQSTALEILIPNSSRRVTSATPLRLSGNGVGQQIVYLDKAKFVQALELLAHDATPVKVTLAYFNTLLAASPAKMFQLSLPLEPGVNTTVALPLLASANEVENALEALSSIGPGGVNVTLDHTVEPGPGATQVFRDTYTITPVNQFANQSTPALSVINLNAAGDLGTNVTRQARAGLLTQDQLNLLKQPGKPAAMFDAILAKLQQLFGPNSPAIAFSADAAPIAPNAYTFKWLIEIPNDDQLAEFPANAFSGLDVYLKEIAKKNSGINSTQAAFRLAKILGDSRRDATEEPVGNFYVQQAFGRGTGPGTINKLEPELVDFFAHVLAHELGHGLGVPHMARMPNVTGTNEVQTISVQSGVANFSLTYAGATTNLFPANATALQVQNGLLTLPGLQGANLLVTGANGGPYTINFNRPGSPAGRLSFVDVPQITGVGVTGSTQTEGSKHVTWTKEVVINGQRGRNDIMRPVVGNAETFLPSISENLLRMSLGTNWSGTESKLAKSALVQAANIGNLLMPLPDPGEDPLPDPQDFLFQGKGLVVFNADGLLASDEPVDFGTVPIGGQPVTRQITITNFGNQDAIVRSVRVTQGYDRFSASPVPVTTLRPGESLNVDVTFSPLGSAPSTGLLAVDSDSGLVGGFVQLTGVGQAADEPEIRVVFGNNNFFGGIVGQGISLFDANRFLPQIQNVGLRPLIISAVRAADGPGQEEYSVSFPQPVTIQPGGVYELNLQIAYSGPGLRPGTIEIVSNDPQTPVIRQPVVGTGVVGIVNGNGFVATNVDLGNDFVAVESFPIATFQNLDTNSLTLRTRSDDRGNWEFFFAPDSLVDITTFDPTSGLVAHSGSRTNAAGQRTVFNVGEFTASGEPDTDGDGLPDDIEFAVGTSVDSTDTDGDGVSDFAELNQGLNPLDDRPTITGVIAALSLEGNATDIKIAASGDRQLAYVATISGLAVVDTTRFDRPVLLGQLTSPGATRVAIDSSRGIAAIAAPSSGRLEIVDVSDPTRPQVLQTIPVAASHVELFDGRAYASVGAEILVFDLVSGEELGSFALGAGESVDSMARDGGLIVTVIRLANNSQSLRVLDLSGPAITLRGSNDSLFGPYTAGNLFVADGVVWIVALNVQNGGLFTVDVSDPSSPALISAPDRTDILGAALALNGSGLGIVGSAAGDDLVLVDTRNPANTGIVLGSLPLAADNVAPNAVAIASGLAYVVGISSGLQVVNYLPFDQGTAPPEITPRLLSTDIDPARPGIQMVETATVTLSARITDDVQVRNVELLVDGVIVRNEVSYPYDFTTSLPTIAETGVEAVLQIRATDTGGNVRLSDPVTIELVPDNTAPTIIALDPAEGSTEPVSRRRVTIRFSEPLDPTTVTAANFELDGPAGVVPPLSVALRQQNTQVELYYPPLDEGDYQLVIDAAAVTDRRGNALGAGDIVSSFRIATIVNEPTIRWINAAGGFWDNPANWEGGRVPNATDDVLIDMPGDPTITFRQGNVEIHSLVSENPFTITGGRLVASDTIQVNDSFILRGTIPFAVDVATLSGTVLRGSGGQGLTVGGFSRLEAATIKTDMTVTQALTRLRIRNGLALQGTATLGNNSAIGFEGVQQVTSGTFIFASSATMEATGPDRVFLSDPIPVATVTFGSGVVIRGGPGVIGQPSFFEGVLHVINHGKISADVADATLTTQAESLINHGILEAKSGGILRVNDKTWTNTSTGRIQSTTSRPNTLQLFLGAGNTTTWSNAGVIDLTDTRAQFNSGSLAGQGWSNTGTLLSQNSVVAFRGRFTTDDIQSLRRSGGFISIEGRMDNTGRTLTFNSDTGSLYLSAGTSSGRIVGGTITTTGPNTRLDFLGGGILDGVTINGDLTLGGFRSELGFGLSGVLTSGVTVVNGLTMNGTVTFSSSGGGENTMTFDGGAQTVTGAAFQVVRDPMVGLGVGVLRANQRVTLDSTVTIRASDRFASLALRGQFTNLAPITIDRDAAVVIQGDFGDGNQFFNRAAIQANLGSQLAFQPFAINESTITSDRARLFLGGRGWRNAGIIEATQSTISFGTGGTIPTNRFQTADFGTIRNPGGTMTLDSGMTLDNANSTLVIDSAVNGVWRISGQSVVDGGTIQVVAGSRLIVGDTAGVTGTGTLKDLTVQGDFEFGHNELILVGNVNFQGTVKASVDGGSLTLGDAFFYPNLPLVVQAGTFDVGGRNPKNIRGSSTSSANITFGSGVVLRGRNVQATFVKPLLNQGSIIANFLPESPSDTVNTMNFTAAPVTNEGLLEATGGGQLTINNLVTNRGTIRAGTGSLVSFGGSLPQAASGIVDVSIAGLATSQFGRVTAATAATLAGTLNVQFVGGFAPVAGNSFQVMTYASASGTFGTVNVTGLPAGLAATPVYNATNLTIVVGAALTAEVQRSSTDNSVSLDPTVLSAFAQEAIARWSGLAPEFADRLAGVQWHVADLPGNTLGMAAGDAVWLDVDAAGYGWFIDPTPQENEEFNLLAGGVLRESENCPAAKQMDLLTVVLHELGHVFGLEHIDDGIAEGHLMNETLSPAERRLPRNPR